MGSNKRILFQTSALDRNKQKESLSLSLNFLLQILCSFVSDTADTKIDSYISRTQEEFQFIQVDCRFVFESKQKKTSLKAGKKYLNSIFDKPLICNFYCPNVTDRIICKSFIFKTLICLKSR